MAATTRGRAFVFRSCSGSSGSSRSIAMAWQPLLRLPKRHFASSSTSSSTSTPASPFDMMDPDLWTSIRRYDAMIPRPQLLQDIMKVSSTAPSFLQEEFRIRCAERICMMEERLPPDFHTTIPELEEVYQKHIQSFTDMRNAHYLRNTDTKDAFLPVVRGIVERGQGLIPLLCRGMAKLIRRQDNDVDEAYVNTFLNEFLLNRIGSNVLMSQYLADATGKMGSIVDPECDVAALCRSTASQVQQLCWHETGFRPVIKVEETCFRPPDDNEDDDYIVGNGNGWNSHNQFPFIPGALSYVIQEILKNSAVATAKQWKTSRNNKSSNKNMTRKSRPDDMPISVVVSSDETHVMIFVGDRACGIPFDVGPHVWSWLYSTRRRQKQQEEKQGQQEKGQQPGQTTDGLEGATDLGGYGVGLPLSRLYVSYLGGTLNLVSIPGYGTHAYIVLPRLPEQMVESVPIRAAGWQAKYNQEFIL